MALFVKTIPIAAIFCAASILAARAGDLPSRGAYAPGLDDGQPPARFQGLYAGVNVGGGFGRSGPASTSGLIGGAQAGYNVQAGNVVFGAEADLGASNVGTSGFTEKTRQTWLGSARARGGYAIGNVLPYVTGGVAVGTTEVKNPAGKTESTGAGWVLGAGAEMRMSQTISVKAEYLYYRLNDATYPTPAAPIKIDNSLNVIRAGVNYKF